MWGSIVDKSAWGETAMVRHPAPGRPQGSPRHPAPLPPLQRLREGSSAGTYLCKGGRGEEGWMGPLRSPWGRGGGPCSIQGDRKGPHATSLHSRPYKDYERGHRLVRIFVRAGEVRKGGWDPCGRPGGGVAALASPWGRGGVPLKYVNLTLIGRRKRPHHTREMKEISLWT
jgi:hypothetical protein